MATKPLLICLGQSNGEPVGNEIEWIIQHPGLFLAITSGIAAGSYNDMFTMPGTFPGFTTLNLKGVAAKESRYLTFYNPWVTGYRSYPGTGRVAAGSASVTSINTEQAWITTSVDFTITRQSTGTTHTVASATGSTLTLDAGTPFTSDPVEGEQFTYSFVAVGAGTTTTVPLNLQWPGAAADGNGKLTGVVLRCLTGANAGLERIISSVNGTTGVVTLSSAWTAASSGETFELVPQGDVDWHEWGYFLPWCPFEGAVGSPKVNPYPPGFNYPNQAATMRTFNPSTGGAIQGQLAAYHSGLGLRVAQLEASDARVVTLAIAGTSLQHSESFLTDASVTGWLDVAQQTHWAPSSENGLFARLMDVLDVAKAAALAEGHTLACYAVVNMQGEADSGQTNWANAYEDNLREFIAAVRKAIKDRGMCSGEAKEIIWVQPKITTEPWGDPGAATVRAAVESLALGDPYVRTFETNGIEKTVGGEAHYSGNGVTTIENRVLDEILDVRRIADGTEAVELCNLALSYIGNKARITSIDPSDGSPEADLCTTFFPMSLKAVLAMHSWSFATEKIAMTVVNADEADTDDPAYLFRYEIPPNLIKIIDVLPLDAPSEEMVGGVNVRVDYKRKRSPTDRKERIYTNYPDAQLRYVMHQIDLSQWDQLSLFALAWHTASMLAGALIKGAEGEAASERCLRRMGQYLAEARTKDSNERQVTLDRPAAQIQARR